LFELQGGPQVLNTQERSKQTAPIRFFFEAINGANANLQGLSLSDGSNVTTVASAAGTGSASALYSFTTAVAGVLLTLAASSNSQQSYYSTLTKVAVSAAGALGYYPSLFNV